MGLCEFVYEWVSMFLGCVQTIDEVTSTRTCINNSTPHIQSNLSNYEYKTPDRFDPCTLVSQSTNLFEFSPPQLSEAPP